MLRKVIEKLDNWIEGENSHSQQAGILPIHYCEILVIGQTALIESKLSIHIAATVDVDIYKELEHSVMKKFESLLKENGKELDPVGHEAWMPKETQYEILFKGKWVTAKLAKPEYIMISKAKKAPGKNRELITDYIANDPPEEFFRLAEKYAIDLNQMMD